MYHPPRVRQKQLFSGMHSLGSVMQTINIQIIIPNIYVLSMTASSIKLPWKHLALLWKQESRKLPCNNKLWICTLSVHLLCLSASHSENASYTALIHRVHFILSDGEMEASWQKHLSGHSVCKHRLGTKYPAYKSLPMHKACLTCFFLPWTINVQFRIHPHLHINKTRNLISHHFRFICSTSLFTTVIQKWNKPVSKTSTFRKKKNK